MLTTSATLLNAAIMAPKRTRRSRFAASPKFLVSIACINVSARNGRVIEIRHNPCRRRLRLIYSDVTERKRNEAEIRAPATRQRKRAARSRLHIAN